jgi:hypothetical protein
MPDQNAVNQAGREMTEQREITEETETNPDSV